MRTFLTLAVAFSFAASSLLAAEPAPPKVAAPAPAAKAAPEMKLKVGDPAPPFELKGTDGKTYKLSDLQGKVVVLAWFPRAMTPGCTLECKSLKTDGAKLRDMGVVYFTASNDPIEKNIEFSKSLELDYPILSDPSNEVLMKYGVFNAERKAATRVTFVIGKDQKIAAIITDVNTKDHANQVAKTVKDLGA
jgi:peroxiredoxin Q/BCP